MPHSASPRLLVVDDDLGVIAAYRLVLEVQQSRRQAGEAFGMDAIESELFGAPQQRAELPAWRVHFVDQGMDAVEAVRAGLDERDPFAAVFLDVRMPPGIDGYETARRIREIDPGVHIVFVTGYSDYEDDELQAVAGGAGRTTILNKPVWPDQLRSVAARFPDRRAIY